jgi:uncharacterized protein (DUF58 family)
MKPTSRCVAVFVAGVPLALVIGLVYARLWTVWIAYLGAAICAAGIDVLLALPRRRLRGEVAVPDQLFIGETGAATITLTGRGWRRALRVTVLAELDDDLVAQPPLAVTLWPPAGGGKHPASGEAMLTLAPRRRGDLRVVALHLKWSGPLGLVERRKVERVEQPVAVVPNVGAVRAVALRMLGSQEFTAGLKVEKYIGDGTEFESLREYVAGLDHRAIDWKASARHRKLLTVEFRAERNHQVVIAIDGGQLMSEPLGGIPRLDHAINAGLMLGWFCLRTGDRVGWTSFDERLRSWADPVAGAAAFPRLQRVSAEAAYRQVETNFTLTIAELSMRLRRRSLVVLFTEFLDTVTAELMIENVRRLARRHLVMFVSLRDPMVETRALVPPASFTALHEAVVANDFIRERTLVLERLRHAGCHCIDTTPDRFSMAIINRYLDVKRRELF